MNLITFMNAAGVEMLVPRNKVAVVLKKQLDPRYIVIMPQGIGIPCIYGGSFANFDELKKDLDLPEFESTTGDIVLVNPDHVFAFEQTENIGVYNLMLSPNFSVGLKTTKTDLERLVSNEGGIVL